MAEEAANLFVSSYLDAGTAYVIDLDHLLVGSGKGLAVAQADWERIPPVARERIIDEINHRHAEAGLRKLRAWLSAPIQDD